VIGPLTRSHLNMNNFFNGQAARVDTVFAHIEQYRSARKNGSRRQLLPVSSTP
jgi:hypothetical protein